MQRVLAIREPKPGRFERDHAGRKAARQQLESERMHKLDVALRTIYEWPAVVRKFKIKSKSLDDTLKKALGLGAGQPPPPEKRTMRR